MCMCKKVYVICNVMWLWRYLSVARNHCLLKRLDFLRKTVQWQQQFWLLYKGFNILYGLTHWPSVNVNIMNDFFYSRLQGKLQQFKMQLELDLLAMWANIDRSHVSHVTIHEERKFHKEFRSGTRISIVCDDTILWYWYFIYLFLFIYFIKTPPPKTRKYNRFTYKITMRHIIQYQSHTITYSMSNIG